MGEVIEGNFGQPGGPKAGNLGINPSDEPTLYKLSPEELVQAAIAREVTLRRTARSHADEADIKAAMAPALRISELLTPEQLEEVYYATEEILFQEMQK